MRLAEIQDIKQSQAVLFWDQLTYMPPGGILSRGEQISTLEQIAQEKFTSKEIGDLLDDLAAYAQQLPYDCYDASLIRVTRRDYERMIKIPPQFLANLTNHQTESLQAWAKARPENDFKAVQPYLEKTLELSRRMADFFPGYAHIADPLIDFHDEGMNVATLQNLFGQLRTKLLPIVKKITSQPQVDDSFLHNNFPEQIQLKYIHNLIKQIGYDFNRGRIDKTHHPVQLTLSLNDVRITTRVREDFLSELLFSTIHEAGHALYEQGINPNLKRTPLARGTSSGVHESQSRLWENIIGRSYSFWEYFYPQLQAAFPQQLGNVRLDTFYPAINKVERSLIRTDADEVTYNLHIMIRFDLELQLLNGDLAIKDLPEAWNERYFSDLGVSPPNNQDGVMQDIHWFGASTIGGAFQGYTLGNILSAQFYQAALKVQPAIAAGISKGNFTNLRNWLVDNIYKHGRKLTTEELVKRVTGSEITIQPYIQYLKEKYSKIYAIDL